MKYTVNKNGRGKSVTRSVVGIVGIYVKIPSFYTSFSTLLSIYFYYKFIAVHTIERCIKDDVRYVLHICRFSIYIYLT